MSNDYFKAQGWFKNYATSSEDSRGMFQQLVKDDEEDFRLASAETDRIKEEMNKKFGSGTIKYGSEINTPPKTIERDMFDNAFTGIEDETREYYLKYLEDRPEGSKGKPIPLKDFAPEFIRENAAEGGRMEFGDGGITEGKGPYRGTFYLRIPNEDGVRIAHSGTKFQMEQVLKKYKERLEVNKIPSNRLTKDQKKIVLQWGKNKSKALGETWSDKKTLKEYNNLKEAMRTKVKTKRVTGTGGSWSEGQIKPLTTEQQKLWDATMADEFGEWEDYPAKDRNRWRGDFPRKQKIYSETKDLLNIDELAEYLGKEFNTNISRNKIRGSFGADNRTAFGKYIRDNLFVDTFGSIKGKIEGEVKGNVSYYKKPTKTQIDQIKKQNLVFDTRTNTLKPKTLKNIKILNKMYGDAYRSGNIPKIKDMIDATGLSGGEIAKAEQKLAQIYNGHKFRNGPTDIRVNKNTANKLFDFMSKAQFGDPRKNELYDISLDLIDEGLGNEKNTFYNLKDKARNILKKNGIKVHSTGSPTGFNIDEFAGVTGSGRSKSMAASQFINIMEGNLNTKTLQNFQGQLSKSRKAVEAAKGTSRYNKTLLEEMEKINTRAANLEAKHEIKLARLERPADINNMSANEVKRLKNIKIGTGENLYQRLVKDAKASGYSIKIPEGSLTIQEFTDPNNARAKELIALVGCPNFKGKQAFAEGGRTGFAEGGDCFDKGQKLINNGMKDASQASMRNFSKFANSAYKVGRNIARFGIIPEAMFVGAESLLRKGMGDTLEEGFKQSIGWYLDPIFGTNFVAEGKFSRRSRDVDEVTAFELSRLDNYNKSLDKVESLKENQKNVLNVYDESLMGGISEQDYKKQSDKNIANAQAELNKNMLSEVERVDFENKGDEAYDINRVKSPIRKAIGKARSDTEMMRYEDDFTGMQSDAFTQDPMSAKAKKDSLSNLLPQKGMRPGLSKFVNFDDRQIDKLSGLTKKPVDELRAYQEYLNNERKLSFADQEKIFGKEQTYGTQGNFFGEKIKRKPMYDYAEGGITGLRSKYEYKK